MELLHGDFPAGVQGEQGADAPALFGAGFLATFLDALGAARRNALLDALGATFLDAFLDAFLATFGASLGATFGAPLVFEFFDSSRY